MYGTLGDRFFRLRLSLLICSALTVFTQMSIISRSTMTRSRHSVAGAVIVTVTFQLAVGTKSAHRTF